ARPRRRDGRGPQILAGARSAMNRRDFAALLLALGPTACDWFKDKKTPLPGERISVLGISGGVEPDPKLAATPVTLPPPAVNRDWPEPGGNPTHAVGHPALPDRLTPAWDTSIGDGSSRYTKVTSQPVIAGGRIFSITDDNELNALSTEDGRRLWSHNGIPETAGLLGGASPAVEGEVVIAPYSSGELFALRVENGRAVWSDSLAASRAVNAVAGLADIRGRPVIDRGKVFAVSHSGRMASIDLRSGDRVWEQQIASSHSPWVVGDYVFVLANDNQLVCLTRGEGKVRWASQLRRYENEAKKSDPIVWAGPVLGGNRLIVLSSLGEAVFVTP